MPSKIALRFFGAAAVSGALLSQPAFADSTERVSVTSAETQATAGPSDGASVSADGRFVAFHSYATNLVPSDNNSSGDIFVRDRRAGTTERVSVDSGGVQADDNSLAADITPDGRFVAFQSSATNLVADDTNSKADVFVHDRQTGNTERVSVDGTGQEGNDSSIGPSISADGRFVAFYSYANNLIAGDTNGQSDVFVHDRQTGATERVSVSSAGAEGSGFSDVPSISADGRYVAFHSTASELVAGDNAGYHDVFVRDRQTSATERVSVDSSGNQANSHSLIPWISADGRYVVFDSLASNLVAGDTNGVQDIFLHDLLTGKTDRLSVDSTGQAGDGDSAYPSISADGRFVAFESDAENLVAGDTNGVRDAFLHDRLTGMTERVSVDSAGAQGADTSSTVRLNANGLFVAFTSSAANLVANDTNSQPDVFLRDQGLLPDGNDDFLADFGNAGLWQRLNDTTWQKIHNGSPTIVASGDLDGTFKDEAIVSFGGSGLSARFNNATWVKLHNGAPTHIVAGDFDGDSTDDLIADFGGAGIWVRKKNSGWAKLHSGTSQDMAVGDLDGNGKDELIVDFGGAGLWVRYNDAVWAKRHNASPVHIATGDLDGNGKDELIADFGGAGLWARYNDSTWTKLHNATSQGFVTGDLDGNDQEELIVDFGGAGLWVRYNNSTWAKRHNASPVRMLATDLDTGGKADLVADFGAAGLWVKHNNGAWTKIHNATTQDLVAGGFD